MSITIDEIVVGDPASAWAAAGFALDADGSTRLGSVRVRFEDPGAGRRIRGWSLRGLPDRWDGDLDGLPTEPSDAPEHAPGAHPLGVVAIDHVVIASPDVDRTVAALGRIGLESRRERQTDTYGMPMRQVFFRLGDVVLELVGGREVADGPAGFFGLALTVADLDAAAARLGPGLGGAKDAVQPGRRIATLRHRDLGMSVAVALMSPEPGR